MQWTAGMHRRFRAFSTLRVFSVRPSWFSPAANNASRWAAKEVVVPMHKDTAEELHLSYV